jgi:hypothetical protein
MEPILTQTDANQVIEIYLQKCKDIGYNVGEITCGLSSLPPDDWLRLVDKAGTQHGSESQIRDRNAARRRK